MSTSPAPRSLWLPVVLVAAALAWRVAKLKFGVADVIPNFAPWMALAFAGSLVMPKKLPWWSWTLLLVGCDLAIGTGQIQYMWLVYVCYGMAAIIGGRLRGRTGVLGTLLGTAACSIAFHLITNTQAWMMSPAYPQTLAGWWQAQTVGDLIHLPQSWIFLVRSLISDLGFASMLVIASVSESAFRRDPEMKAAEAAA